MSKMTITALLVASTFIASPVNATGFLHQLHQHPAPKASAPTHKKALFPESTADFSGDWIGDCVDDEGNVHSNGDSVLTVNSDVYGKITIDGESFSIGNLNTNALSGAGFSHFEHTSFDWTEDGSTLLVNDNGALYYNSEFMEHSMHAYYGNGRMFLNDGHLVIDSTHYEEGTAEHSVCTFHKATS